MFKKKKGIRVKDNWEKNVATCDNARHGSDAHISTYSHSSKLDRAYKSGKRTDHPYVSMRHPNGTRGVAKIAIPAIVTKHNKKATQNRFKILGTSMKKLDRSTSFFVALQLILNENR